MEPEPRARGAFGLDLDAVPATNLVSAIVPAGLMAMWFATSGLLPVAVEPAILNGPTLAESAPRPGLSIHVLREGYALQWFDPDRTEEDPERAWIVPIPCMATTCTSEETYDQRELVRVLGLVKDAHPDVDQVTILPGPEVSYRAVSATVRVSRADTSTDGGSRPLFPFAVVSGD